jgi:uncharacterized phage protein (TIGR01671 family)
MRELKFRAYDNINKEWLLGYKECGGFSMIGELMLMGEWQAILSKMLKGEFGEDGKGCIIQQYTGLKDKNGVDIYEGDTLIWYGKDHKAPVVFSPTSAAFVLDTSGRHLFDDKYGDHLDLHKDHEYEIIGNIFENKEPTK